MPQKNSPISAAKVKKDNSPEYTRAKLEKQIISLNEVKDKEKHDVFFQELFTLKAERGKT